MNTQEVQMRIFTFGQFAVERRSEDGEWEEVSVREWNGYRSPQSLLGYLLCSSKRFATRSSLLRDLGPFKGDPDKAVSNAASLIRKVCPPSILQTLGGRHNNSYQLADQSIVWADCDACQALTQTTGQQKKTSQEKLTSLEQALALLQRGPFLEDEEGLWCYGERGMWEKRYYQYRLQLAEMYEQQRQFDRAEMLYSALLSENMQDEIALCRLMMLLSQQGLSHLARKRYEEARTYLQRDQLTLSPTVEALFQNLQNLAPGSHAQEIIFSGHAPNIRPQNTFVSGSVAHQEPATILSRFSQRIMPSILYSGAQSMDYSRRQMLYGMLAAACTTLTLSPYVFLQAETKKRLLMSLQKPSQSAS